MDTIEKKKLLNEAQMQMSALKRISIWRTIAIAISTLGVAMTYAAMTATSKNILFSILGIIIILTSLVIAIILNLGLKNGRKNVEKILNILDKGMIK